MSQGFDNKNILKHSDSNPNFSELYVSYDVNGSPNSLFTLNFRSMFLNNTLYGKTLLNLDEGLFNEVMKRFKIAMLNIDRQQVQPGLISNSLSSPINYASTIEGNKNILNTHDQDNFLLNLIFSFDVTFHAIILNTSAISYHFNSVCNSLETKIGFPMEINVFYQLKG